MVSATIPSGKNYTVESDACRPRANSSSVAFAVAMIPSASETASSFAPGTTTYISSAPRLVYTRFPMQPSVETVPCASAAGSAMHDGRPSSGSVLLAPARMEASLSSIDDDDLQLKITTLGARGASPSGANTTAAGSLGKRGMLGTS